MSKIGKKNIDIPNESSIKVSGSNLTISGPKGTKTLNILYTEPVPEPATISLLAIGAVLAGRKRK